MAVCKCFSSMCTAVETPTLVASFQNDEVGLCANVRDYQKCNEFEVAVVDAFSGDVVISRQFTTREAALEMAEVLTAAWNQQRNEKRGLYDRRSGKG
jgi:hypothetical protein